MRRDALTTPKTTRFAWSRGLALLLTASGGCYDLAGPRAAPPADLSGFDDLAVPTDLLFPGDMAHPPGAPLCLGQRTDWGYSVPPGSPSAIVAADWDADRIDDFAVFPWNAGAGGSLFLHHNAPEPRWLGELAQIRGNFGVPGAVFVGDLNGDGRPDVAGGNNDSPAQSRFNIFLSAGPDVMPNELLNAQAPWLAMAPDTTAIPCAVAGGDLDGDGRRDLAALVSNGTCINNQGPSRVAYTQNTGDIATPIARPPTFIPLQNPNAHLNSIVLADRDANGRAEIVLGSADGVAFYDRGYTNLGLAELGHAPSCMTVGNLDGSTLSAAGGRDVVLGLEGSVVVIPRDGELGNASKSPGTEGPPSWISLADLNNDGYLDVMAIDPQKKKVVILVQDPHHFGFFLPPARFDTNQYWTPIMLAAGHFSENPLEVDIVLLSEDDKMGARLSFFPNLTRLPGQTEDGGVADGATLCQGS